MTTLEPAVPWWEERLAAIKALRTFQPIAAVPVNSMGHGRPTTYDKLTDRQKRRFDAQLAVWRAACDLVTASTEQVTYGVPVPYEPIRTWYSARKAWERNR